MSCSETRDRFGEKLDGRLDAPRQQAFDAHLAACPDCRREWEAYTAVWQVLGRHEPVEPSFGFVERTLRRLEEPAAAARAPWWRLSMVRWATVASLVIAAGIGGRIGWRRVQENRDAQIYASVNDADVLGEDFDVIASLDQLNVSNGQEGKKP